MPLYRKRASDFFDDGESTRTRRASSPPERNLTTRGKKKPRQSDSSPSGIHEAIVISSDTDEVVSVADSTSEVIVDEDEIVSFEKGDYLEEADPVNRTLWDEKPLPKDAEEKHLRVLHHFDIFEAKTRHRVPISHLWEGEGASYRAYGYANPVNVDEDGEETYEVDLSNGANMLTSVIMRYFPELNLDYISIETEFAFYALKTPSASYRRFFDPFYIKEMTLRYVLIYAQKKPNIPLENLVTKAARQGVDDVLGRRWEKKDFLDNFTYTEDELHDVVGSFNEISSPEEIERICSTPIVVYLLGHSESTPKLPNKAKASRRTPNAPPISMVKRKKMKKQRTAVTPFVHAIASKYYDVDLDVVGQIPSYVDINLLDVKEPFRPYADLDYTPKLGDIVVINEGEWNDKANECFAQIVKFSRKGKMFHARWFCHGSKTILGELALGQELFLSVGEECRDVPTECIVTKCEAVRLTLNEYASQKWPAEGSYFYCYAWDRRNPADFKAVTEDQVKVGSCATCYQMPISEYRSDKHSIIRTVDYHVHDFIRYKRNTPGQITCSIGQVRRFKKGDDELQVEVCKLGRFTEREREMSLYMCSETEIIEACDVLGKCQVLHLDEYKKRDPEWIDDHMDTYYVHAKQWEGNKMRPMPTEDFRICLNCAAEEKHRYQILKSCQKGNILRSFDPFVGVGGLGMGISRGCSMRTVLGVEINESACKTMRENFPEDTEIINDDASQILKKVVNGKVFYHYKDANDEVQKVKLARGNIDLIYSGPPCQNDSTLNRHRSDKKRPILTALSYIDLLRPDFVILEFVPGAFRTKVSQEDLDELIEAGEMKLVLKILRLFGYNVLGRVANARTFGTPQSRDRFMVIASSPKYDPVSFPEPTHAFDKNKLPRGRKYRNFSGGLKFQIASGIGTALHEVINVGDAISDLPKFDWSTPKPLTKREKDAHKLRETAKMVPTIPCDSDPDSVWGFIDEEFQYTSPPLNKYQFRARRDVVLCNEKRIQHYTRHFGAVQVQNVWDVPFSTGADYRHLNQQNREWGIRDPASSKARSGFRGGAYTRLDPKGYFHTITTNVGPLAKQDAVLHPECKRIITIRELARAQGFPDDFSFHSVNDNVQDYITQIGNSVPFGLSEAIGRSIQEVIFRKWQEEQ